MMNSGFNSSREVMLQQVNQAGFAAVEANLYLDTHPCDVQAIAYYNQMSDAYENAKRSYEAQFGPLTASASRGPSYWSWTDDPWPWEGGKF